MKKITLLILLPTFLSAAELPSSLDSNVYMTKPNSAFIYFRDNGAQVFDKGERPLVVGPIFPGDYSNIHIISDTYGIYSNKGLTLNNVVIDASQSCVVSEGSDLIIRDSFLYCGYYAIEFKSRLIINNHFSNNEWVAKGGFTNRPDIFR